LVIKSLCVNIGFILDKRAYIQKDEYKGHGETRTTCEEFHLTQKDEELFIKL